ncbi:NNP family nitrate/nitrite transporter-like MFS transporter [Nocardioides zeae]|uniref:NNP family nitrate/nitrite transporter-like MFS transporter n=1 Tax=Nocardioides zeae TaxID=1457234 RepID=A0ACC6ILG3_9ACTN|nr:nitrate/nitrite transporter [Nocardioides zeae]MDR6173992.1 NNP family nitrate/nitrite transporter-like MFS transporter [Nocardioides zeae]MDR6211453.1 NNP family nitrate/nitrite transporter-like MFS transporter [Nocardioides zeae]
MTTIAPPPVTGTPTSTKRRTRRWIDDWRPEDEQFWATTGQPVARRNLLWSIFAEHLGFSVWLIWSVSSAYLVAMGFAFSPQQLFLLVAIPNLVGSLLRIPYTFAVGLFGGRNWTIVSAALLLVPTLGFAAAVTNEGTPYWVFCVIAATAGFGGGNFASSMANINYFYPTAKKGAALGLNAAGGNLGVALIQLLLPVVVGGAGIFGLVTASEGGIHLERAALLYAGLAVAATVAAWLWMDNLGTAVAKPREQLRVVKEPHTWIMSVLYIGTFGSFIGYSAAMPLLIKLNFWVPEPAPLGTGIYFAYYAFLGAGVGSVARPVGGWLADRYGGAKVTLAAFAGLAASTLAVLWTVFQLTPNPTADPAIATENESLFPLFLGFFLLVFACTGIGNGSTYKMIPAIWRRRAEAATPAGTPEHTGALAAAGKQASAALGVIGAVGAIGGFLIPLAFSAPWVADPLSATKGAFMVFAAYYVLCAAVTYGVYLRRGRTAAHV